MLEVYVDGLVQNCNSNWVTAVVLSMLWINGTCGLDNPWNSYQWQFHNFFIIVTQPRRSDVLGHLWETEFETLMKRTFIPPYPPPPPPPPPPTPTPTPTPTPWTKWPPFHRRHFSHAFSWMKSFVFWLLIKYNLRLFLGVQLTVF